MRWISLIPLLFLISCCPKDGIDKSTVMNDFILAIDYYNYNTPVEADLVPVNELKLSITDEKGFTNQAKHSNYTENINRIEYYFDSTLKEESIKRIDGTIGNMNFTLSNFNLVKKSVYQKDPISLANNTLYSRTLCFLNNIGEFLLPSAKAMSCKAKAGSKLSYREGTLIRVDLESF